MLIWITKVGFKQDTCGFKQQTSTNHEFYSLYHMYMYIYIYTHTYLWETYNDLTGSPAPTHNGLKLSAFEFFHSILSTPGKPFPLDWLKGKSKLDIIFSWNSWNMGFSCTIFQQTQSIDIYILDGPFYDWRRVMAMLTSTRHSGDRPHWFVQKASDRQERQERQEVRHPCSSVEIWCGVSEFTALLRNIFGPICWRMINMVKQKLDKLS